MIEEKLQADGEFLLQKQLDDEGYDKYPGTNKFFLHRKPQASYPEA